MDKGPLFICAKLFPSIVLGLQSLSEDSLTLLLTLNHKAGHMEPPISQPVTGKGVGPESLQGRPTSKTRDRKSSAHPSISKARHRAGTQQPTR